MKKLDCIVYSKNRPCQLDLLMRSISSLFLNAGNIYILYAYSNNEFKAGYEKFFKQWEFDKSIIGVPETTFANNVATILGVVRDYYCGLGDDDVFVKETDCSELLAKLDEPDVNAVSLKAGLNIKGNYPNFIYPLPNFIEDTPFLKWEWRLSDSNADWGYPTCVNSYIFKKDYLLDLMKHFSFNNPPTYEGGLNSIKFQLMKKYMVSFRESRMLNIPANGMQTLVPTKHSANTDYSAENLNRKYLDGYFISTTNMFGYVPSMGNEERDFIMETLL